MALLVGPMHTLHVQTQARSNMLHYDGPRTVSQRMTASLPRHGEHPREEPKYHPGTHECHHGAAVLTGVRSGLGARLCVTNSM
jgi:hypothetical protein